MLNVELKGKIGVKVSTGEKGARGYLKADLIGPLVKQINGTIIECNTAYDGARNTVREHLEVANDQAFIDMIWSSKDPGSIKLQERIDRQLGRKILTYAESIGLGTTKYELINLD